MPAPTYGATTALLEERYWGGHGVRGLGDRAAQAEGVISEIASDVETALLSVGADTTKITEADTPRAYRWLQATVLVGAAAEFTRRTAKDGQIDVAESWGTQFRDRLKQLRSEPQVVLPDSGIFAASHGSAYDIPY